MSEKKVSLLNRTAIRQELVLRVFNCFLQGDDVSFHRFLPFDSSFFSTSRSWVPVMNAEPSLFGQSVGHLIVKFILSGGWNVFSGW